MWKCMNDVTSWFLSLYLCGHLSTFPEELCLLAHYTLHHLNSCLSGRKKRGQEATKPLSCVSPVVVNSRRWSTLWEKEREAFPYISHVYTQGNSPGKASLRFRLKAQAWALAPCLFSQEPSQSIEHSGAAPLPGGSSILWITQVSQGWDLGLGVLMCLNSGCPQVFYTSTATGNITWPGEVLTDPVPHLHWVWILLTRFGCSLGPLSFRKCPRICCCHMGWYKHTL
jgi:hypothetical protein